MPRQITSLRLVFLLFLLPASVLGQGTDQNMDTDLARRYYKLGEDLYNRADYEEALKQFKKSYQHSKKSALLYNIGRCEESLGHWGKAIKMYQQYLTIPPPNANMIQARINNLQRLIRKKEAVERARAPATQPVAPATQPSPASAPTPPRPAAAVEEKKPPSKRVEDQPLPERTLADAPVTKPRSRGLRIAGWTLVGVGGASLVAGIVLGALSSSKASDLEQAWKRGEPWENWRNIASKGETYEAAAMLTLIVGGVVAATGATLVIVDYLRQPKDSERRRVWITPAITSAGPAISAGLRF